MSAPQGWERVQGLRPRLRSHAAIHRHRYRGALWYVLEDRASGRYHRFTPGGYLMVGLMDGRRSVGEILEIARSRLGAEAPGEAETMQLLMALYRSDLLLTDGRVDLGELEARSERVSRQRVLQYFLNPFAVRLPLLDPDRMLERLAPLYRPAFSPVGLGLWLLLVAAGLAVAVMNWPSLTHNVLDQVFSIENLVILWFVYPMLKALHELGHACAVKAWGGEVHEMGVMFLVFVPVPYVDASSAIGFADKRQRIVVGAGGMMFELALAALASFVWVSVEPGLVRAIAFNVMLVAGFSTVLFNANPLVRFDGYYMLADWLESPNLAQRASQYLGYLIARHVFRSPLAQPPAAGPGERAWLAAYALGSVFYRLFLLASIVLTIASRYFFVGILLAIWGLFGMVVMPIARAARTLALAPQLEPVRARAVSITATVIAVATLALWFLPLPASLRTEGVVWVPEHAHVRTLTEGTVARVVARLNQPVRRGDLLLEELNPDAAANAALLEAQLAEVEAQLNSVMRTDLVRANVLREQGAHLEARLERARARIRDLAVRSPADGIFIMPEIENAPGRFLQRGERLGYVTDFSDLTVRTIVPQDEIDRVRSRVQRVEMRPVHRIEQIVRTQVLRELPGATDELPSLALSLAGGGRVGLDPTRPTEARAAESLFLFDLELPREEALRLLGSRYYVRFVFEPEPLGRQWYRELRGLLLKRFAT